MARAERCRQRFAEFPAVLMPAKGSARDQVDGFGNAVSPQVGEWIGGRLRAVLHGREAVA
jgi:site-specific DNA-cytosine methylase